MSKKRFEPDSFKTGDNLHLIYNSNKLNRLNNSTAYVE